VGFDLLLKVMIFDINMFGPFRRAAGRCHVNGSLVIDTQVIW
jgi:hypothetical protein